MKKVLIKYAIPVFVLLLAGIGFLVYQNLNPPREKIIQQVITTLYTSPNPKITAAITESIEIPASARAELEEGKQVVSIEDNPISQVTHELYGKYLTEDVIKKLNNNRYSIVFTQYCDKLGYEVKVENIELSQPQPDKDYYYNIKVDIAYGEKGNLDKRTTQDATISFDKTGETNMIDTLWMSDVLRNALDQESRKQ